MRPLPVVTVVGSLNLDLVASVARLPRPGETVAASNFATFFGGKGANQATAAARQNARVHVVGCVGDDEGGRAYRRALEKSGIGVEGVLAVKRERTGSAWITVETSGENQIVIVPAANNRLTPALVRKQAQLLRDAGAVLLQLETPIEAVCEAIGIADRAGVRVILNPSPWRDDFPWGQLPLSTVIVNEAEAAQLSELPPEKLVMNVSRLRRRMRDRCIQELVITRGGESTLCVTADRAFETPTLPVKPIDTVGAGDTFAGTLAARLAGGEPLEEAIRFANTAGALATLGMGAQPSMPSRRVTERAVTRLGVTRELLSR